MQSRPRRPPAHRREPKLGFSAVIVVLALLTAAVWAWRSEGFGLYGPGDASAPGIGASAPGGSIGAGSPRASSPSVHASPTSAGASEAAPTAPAPGPINTKYPGLTTFRGNATRDYYGAGPVPTRPVLRWRAPRSGGYCGTSSNLGVTKVWCGTGWTGQPNVIQHPNRSIEVREGAYDGHYHFLNGRTGEPYRPDLVTGDLAKGSATSDADGYPLYYAGSRDDRFRIVALDRKGGRPTVLWSYDARSNPHMLWNDDWDGAALQVGDYLMEGCENSWFYIWKLNRRYDADGLVQVDPKLKMLVPGYDGRLLHDLGDEDVSIENSVAYDANRGVVYFANSGGLVQGWNVEDILHGGSHYERVFRFWDGDETDASIVIGSDGSLYVGRHASFNVPTRPQVRDQEVGSLMKLDPRKPNDPVVWSVQLGGFEPDGGVLGTPALYQGIVYATWTEGGVAAIDAETGHVLWKESLPGPIWSSPVPIDDRLIVADGGGGLNCFDIAGPRAEPKLLWHLQLSDGTIESTPAVWHGWIYVGSRDGGIYGVADRSS
jgi:outer membrane protein assembly factor BamB